MKSGRNNGSPPISANTRDPIECSQSIERFATSVELAPHDPLAFNAFVGLGCAHFDAGRYADTVHAMERALAEHPSAAWAHRVLCPAYVFLGRTQEAERSLAAMRRLYPEATIAQVTGALPLPQAFRDRVANDLDTLGMAP